METQTDKIQWVFERFDDKQILRYIVPGFEKLTLKQKSLVYCLAQAGYSGRDIIYAQNHRFNLAVRKALEAVYVKEKELGSADDANFKEFVVYLKCVHFSNGIHHHYSSDKFQPGFTREWFEGALKRANATLSGEILDALFDPKAEAKKREQAEGKDLVLESAGNFYAPGITTEEVKAFYAKRLAEAGDRPDEIGINSRIERDGAGNLVEKSICVKGLYSEAMTQVVYWLKRALSYTENDSQKAALLILIEYFETGDVRKWSEYNVAWAQATEGDVDYILGFVEIYEDPLNMKGSFEAIIQVNDLEASERLKVLSLNAQWFEDHAPLLPEHKKKNVSGISYRVISAVAESGDSSPSTPIGVNLPNANWIRERHGSKSISLGNIENAYDQAKAAGMLNEFYLPEVRDRVKQWRSLSGKLHTALHEVLGHASGTMEPGVGEPHATLGGYYSPLEEARADLFALYYIMDPKLIELNVMPTLDVGKAEYDTYITGGLLTQLDRIKLGKTIEEAHMRNRALVARWALEKGSPENVIEKVVSQEGKTFYRVNDYLRLRTLFGQLLCEIQRIKSKGLGEEGKQLVENYGVKIDPTLHTEVLERARKLNLPKFYGFINPQLDAVFSPDGAIVDVKISYPDDFTNQHLYYGKTYGFLSN